MHCAARIVAALLPLMAAVAAQPAAAQNLPDTVEALATDLAYSYCPLYLADQFPLAGNPKLLKMGFIKPMQSSANPRGELELVGQTRGKTDVTFGGIEQQVCQVNVINGDTVAVLAKLRKELTRLHYDFKPDTANSGTKANGVLVETLKTQLDATTILRVQFVQGKLSDGSSIAGFQIFGMDQ